MKDLLAVYGVPVHMKEPLITVNLGAPQPAVHQIAEQLRTLMVEGHLAPECPLPPIRRLAVDLGLHFNTVAEAYRALAREGWLEITHGKRAKVVRRETPHTSSRAPTNTALRDRLRHLTAHERSMGLSTDEIQRELINFAGDLGRRTDD